MSSRGGDLVAFGMEDKKDGEKRKVMSAKEWHGEVEEGGGTVHGELARTGGREPPRSVVLRGRRKRGVRPLLDLRERELNRKGREMSSKAGGEKSNNRRGDKSMLKRAVVPN